MSEESGSVMGIHAFQQRSSCLVSAHECPNTKQLFRCLSLAEMGAGAVGKGAGLFRQLQAGELTDDLHRGPWVSLFLQEYQDPI